MFIYLTKNSSLFEKKCSSHVLKLFTTYIKYIDVRANTHTHTHTKFMHPRKVICVWSNICNLKKSVYISPQSNCRRMWSPYVPRRSEPRTRVRDMEILYFGAYAHG